VVVYGNSLDLTNGNAGSFGKVRAAKRWSGGAATAMGAEEDLFADKKDDATHLLRTNVTSNTVYAEVDGGNVNAAKWGIDFEVHITTSNA
jgi:hypothetical protein